MIVDREPASQRRLQISAIPVTGDRTPFTVVPPHAGIIGQSRLSPDGHWLVYASDEAGRFEIYVVSFPDGERRVQISRDGGSFPRWSRGGREILYTAQDTVMSVAIDGREVLHAVVAKPLFSFPDGAWGWDVPDDGERSLAGCPWSRARPCP